ncbi:hypothetical protein QQ008_14725 [Fulvivirgaceae bacterium BMA10]|uniref:Sulfatase N-terminal domain-containing protein n=1 Tax=Splendidivirga corallicola TaxID=3051826 RepID=A0ABT8KPK0_9BACT|nr:hypothetical protein [Fulvivirgaceae bacterium BMA10]
MRLFIEQLITKKEVGFWFLFFLLNSLLFLPWYLMDMENTQFFPVSYLIEGSLYDRLKSIFNRYNYDIFRLSLDFFLLTISAYLLSKWFSKSIRSLMIFFIVLYLLLLFYQLYSSFFQQIYSVTPLFFNDFTLLKNGYQIFISSFSFNTFLLCIATVLLIGGIVITLKLMLGYITQLKFGIISWGFVVVFIVMGAMSFYRYKKIVMPNFGFQMISKLIVDNIQSSFQTMEAVNNMNFQRLEDYNKSIEFDLRVKPNIYVLFIESYGRICLDNKELRTEYYQWMDSMQIRLKDENWSVASALSEAPVKGGGSWVSYTSFTLGYSLKNRGVFRTFLEDEKIKKYNHFFRWLRNKGYKNYRLTSLVEPKNFSIPWDTYSAFYSVDQWIRFSDLDFQGKLVGAGPAPPDQYSLNYAYELIKEDNQKPFTLFFITKNSHNPFVSPTNIAEDWSSLNLKSNTGQKGESIFTKPSMDNYKNSIKYELRTVEDFIIKNGTNDDLFLIIGDHQPPVLTSRNAGFETPFHIISKDKELIHSFTAYGFKQALIPSVDIEPLKHEGFYSIFLREMKRHYGKDSTNLPPYLPNGINLDAK